MSTTTSDAIATTSIRAAELGGRELARAIGERAARDPSTGERLRPPEGERLFLCWLDRDGGEEVFARDATHAHARCRELHGERRDSRHCRCETQ